MLIPCSECAGKGIYMVSRIIRQCKRCKGIGYVDVGGIKIEW